MTVKRAGVDDDKFVIRMSESLFGCVDALASYNDRSFNSEVRQALLHWFDAESSPKIIRKLLESKLGPIWASIALSKVESVSVEGPNTHKFSVRLLPGQRTRLKDAASATQVSMNTYALCTVGWWLTMNRETESLLDVFREHQDQL